MNESDLPKCPECGHPWSTKSEYDIHHSRNCSLIDLPSALFHLKRSEQAENREAEYRRFWHDQAKIWEGKFHAVKRENNQLRKKLYPNK